MLISGLVLPVLVAALTGGGAWLARVTLQVRAEEALERQVTFFRAEEDLGGTDVEREFARRERRRAQGELIARRLVSGSAYPTLIILLSSAATYGWDIGRGLADPEWRGGVERILSRCLAAVIIVCSAQALLAVRETILARRGAASAYMAANLALTDPRKPLNDITMWWYPQQILSAIILASSPLVLGLAMGIAVTPTVTLTLRGLCS